ncbi:PilC/PilY family type IV pilus protein [Catenovulum sp. 2E275]|uniref:pilus assembly protein n=1 Tax=Catenovulum sp. 2E275 TaxID=2980497 RepID=UPI0021D25DDB|nr:PilC/PilY family type IV pilus protein [Catenovulum sp. 2E275]MCU4676279.1 PilC/PilY family type IV pilus protein [Catenovulum sp. 2E275]
MKLNFRIVNYALLLLSLVSGLTYAEDIELYVRSISDRVGSAPQVLIIFDNSGSMASSETIKASYDPTQIYPGHYTNGANDRAVFFSVGATGLEQVPEPDDERRFNELINACNQSFIPLYGLWRHNITGNQLTGLQIEQSGLSYDDYELIEGGQGFYSDRVAEYYSSGRNRQTWQSLRLNNGMNATDIMDCLGDILEVDQNNPGEFGAQNGSGTSVGNGLPVNGYSVGSGSARENKTHYLVADPANIEADESYQGIKANFADVAMVTLYTGNYLNWLTANTEDVGSETKSRLEIAKQAISSVINATSNVDFGLALFNYNYRYEGSNDGGRIVSAIQPRDSSQTNILLNTIDEIQAETNTPLCETLYEAYRYFAGRSVKYGNENGTGSPRTVIRPLKDTSAENSGQYISPFSNNCRNESYVILITDGAPTVDDNANDAIRGLPRANTRLRVNGSYLPVLSHWMLNNDVNSNLDGNQHVVTYTIGFGTGAVDAEPILRVAAEQGGGAYYAATDPNELAASLQKALISIIEESASFTSPSVASNNFDQTRSLNSVYYSMFYPESGPRWPGNLKKLKVEANAIIDANGQFAIDTNGNITSSTFTFWGATEQCANGELNCADGNDVNKGGVAEYLASQSASSRTIYTNTAPGGNLSDFTDDNLSSQVDNLAEILGVSNDAEQADLINWARGDDVFNEDNNSATTTRSDVFGDPLHSKPLVLNYGGASEAEQDLRIVVGTNAGFLHMFNDQGASIVEDWAFIPKSLFPNLNLLKNNQSGSAKVYGMDSSAVAYIKDSNGQISSADGDKVWLFSGMRRGGNEYFAFDVSQPNAPSMMWTIQGESSEFPTLGQTWSQPNVSFIKLAGHTAGNPVLIFGGGYVNDSDSSGTTLVGRGLYIIDAQTGNRLWSFTPSSTLSRNTYVDIQDAMPAKIATLDSDFDGYVDRLYASDLGGNVWRMDLYSSDPSNWTSYKLASVSASAAADKRKFFNEPTIVRTFFKEKKLVSLEGEESSSVVVSKEIPYEGILLGSGNRAWPNNTQINDKLYLIQDRNVLTQSFSTAPAWSGISEDDLYDMTDDPFTNASTQAEVNDLILNGLSQKKGWFINLTRSGEKSLSSARVIGGVAYFTSYTPPASAILSNTCEIKAGTGRLYAMDLTYGTQIYSWREKDIGNRIPDTPVTYAGENEAGESLLSFIGVGEGEDGTGVIKAKGSSGEPSINCEDENCNLDFGLKTYMLYQRVTEQE